MNKKPSSFEKAVATFHFKKFENTLFKIEMVGKICNIPTRTLANWEKKNILPHQKPNDVNKWNTFTLKDILVIKIISFLRSKNVLVKDIKKFCDWLNHEDKIKEIIENAPYKDTYVLTDFEDNYHILIGEENFCRHALEMTKTYLFAFDLTPIIYQTVDELKKLKI